jgi:hypothetical protein
MELILTETERNLVNTLRQLEEVSVGRDFYINVHYVPIVDFGSEKHKLILGSSTPVPLQRIREPMKQLMQDIKKGNLDSDFLFLLCYDSNFKLLRLLKVEPLTNA